MPAFIWPTKGRRSGSSRLPGLCWEGNRATPAIAHMLRGAVSLLAILAASSAASAPDFDGAAPADPRLPLRPDLRAGMPVPAAARPLPFFYDLYTFRGQGGSTTVVAAFAVPAENLEELEAEDGVWYRFYATLVLADTALRSVSRTDDSVFVRFERPLPGEHLLYTQIEVQAPPSASTVQRVIMSDPTLPGIGQLYQSSFPIPDYTGKRLMLSDIALGQPDVRAGWQRGDVRLALLPTSHFPASAFEVYYEIYNLPAGNRYGTEIYVEAVDDAGRRIREGESVRLRFAGESAAHRDGTLPELRRVETSLPKGSYRITVTISDADTGQTASRSRLFEVRAGGPVTLVAAVPRGGSRPPRN